jgi:hypothetical protein
MYGTASSDYANLRVEVGAEIVEFPENIRSVTEPASQLVS